MAGWSTWRRPTSSAARCAGSPPSPGPRTAPAVRSAPRSPPPSCATCWPRTARSPACPSPVPAWRTSTSSSSKELPDDHDAARFPSRAAVGAAHRPRPRGARGAAVLPRAAAGGVRLRLPARDAGDLRGRARRRRARRRRPVHAVLPGRDRRDRDHADQLPGGRLRGGHRARERLAGAAAAAGHAAAGLLRRQGRPGAADGGAAAGAAAAAGPLRLRRADAAGPGALGDVPVGRRPRSAGRHGAGDRGVRAAGQLHRDHHLDHRVRHRAPVLLRGVLRLPGVAGLDAAGGGPVPAEVADPGHALGVPARPGRRVRDRGGMGARQDGPGAGRMGDHRDRGVRPDLPLAPERGVTSAVRQLSAVPAAAGDGGRLLLSEGIRRAVVLVLHVAFVVVVGAAVLTVLAGTVDAPRSLLLAVLAVWVLGYGVLGVPSLVRTRPRLELAYVVVLVAVVGVLAWTQPSLLFVMFLAFPQVWFFTGSVRAAVIGNLALAVAGTLGPLIAWSQGDEPLWGPGETLVGLVLSLAMGLWVTRVLTQSAERAQLIRELESTRAELAAAHHEQGVAAERERWAREVHDTLAQGYTSIVVLAQTAAAQLGPDPEAARERLGLIEEVARENLAEARGMVAAFSPVPLEGATLVEALHRLAERFGRETGMSTRVDTAALEGAPALSRNDEVVLLRGAQEALSNVRRHAGASAVVPRLSPVGGGGGGDVGEDRVRLRAARREGHGLAGLRSRVAEAGGELDVVSAPGEGTRVTVRVPGA